ncbi:MAG: Electron transport complex protein RnfA [Oscillospiraceae bacterium]|jgi:Na+-translocating ferredoxin:NAD+ oxidoreductase subunit A
MILRMFYTAFLAVGVENLLFSGGVGFSRALRAAQRRESIGVYALLITWFSLLSMLFGIWLKPVLPAAYGPKMILRSSYLAAAAVAAYVITYLLARFLLPIRFMKKISVFLAPAAVNTVVLAMPYVQWYLALKPEEAIGYALGTGAAFYLASVVLSYAEEKCRNPDIPSSFQGLPALILYIGILSMAFAGFAGSKII